MCSKSDKYFKERELTRAFTKSQKPAAFGLGDTGLGFNNKAGNKILYQDMKDLK